LPEYQKSDFTRSDTQATIHRYGITFKTLFFGKNVRAFEGNITSGRSKIMSINNQKQEPGTGLKVYKSTDDLHTYLITVITVVLNNPEGLRKTIESVLAQTYNNIEYIIIDGGSAKSTLDVIKEYERGIAYWISEPDKGTYDAMNKGIEFATGDYINFMNADDWFYSKNTIENIFLQQHGNSDFIYGDTVCRYDQGKVKYFNALTVDDLWKYMIFFHQSSFMKKSIVEKQKFGLKYKISNDYELIYNAYNNGARFFKIDQPVSVYYRNGISHQKFIRRYFENWMISRKFNKHQGFKHSHFSLIPKRIYKEIITLFGRKNNQVL
jgi:glycosyltransferase involved in cell wall biosynthesis